MTDQYVQLLLKYKNQVTIAVCFIMSVVCFVGGRYSVHIPPRQVVCEDDIKAKETAMQLLSDERKQCLTDKRLLEDTHTKVCDKRIADELDKYKVAAPKLDCRIAKSLEPQCRKRGQWK